MLGNKCIIVQTSTQTLTNKTLTSPTLTGSVNVSNVNFTGHIVTVDDGLFIKETNENYGGIIRFWNNDNSKYIHFQPAPAGSLSISIKDIWS